MLLFTLDFLAIIGSFYLWTHFRSTMGFYTETSFLAKLQIAFIVYLYWLVIFSFYGLYKTWFTRSRTDEFISVFKTVSIGVFFIFLITFDIERDVQHPFSLSRWVIVTYWALMILLVGFARVLLRTIHRQLLARGIGLRRTLIIGWGKKANELFDNILESPALGYEVVGFISSSEVSQRGKYKGVSLKGSLSELTEILSKEGIQEMIVALSRRSERQLEEVIAQCEGTSVGIKIVPDLYDVIIGQVRTNQIYGFPLIEILPQLMPAWELSVKRLMDIGFSLVLLMLFLPLGLLLAPIIILDSKGPVFYFQDRVGKDGKIFKMIKFRSMVVGAEKMTGPVWAKSKDPRMTRVGRIIRKLRLDELPQFFNILEGDMSLVGPRPERPYFVEKLKKVFPLYSRRLLVRPGVTGWAQIKGEYDQSLEHVKQKISYDLFYLENMSLRMDIKIILSTIAVVLRGKGH